MIFKNNKTYDILKYLALVVFNAIGVFYKGIAEIWNLPYGNEVALTCSALALLVGTLIGVSSHKYNKTELIAQYYQEEENALVEETNEKGEE
jgi:hypothetical protein